MKWEVVDDELEADSRYHDDNVPFRWRIREDDAMFMLTATSELWDDSWGDQPMIFSSVIEAMTFADEQDSLGDDY